jgi:DnaD/phage-associated family protein
MDEVRLELSAVRKLIGAADGDTALVYLYLQAGGDQASAGEALRMPAHRVDRAMASLRQMGLAPEKMPRVLVAETRPQYTELDVKNALQDSSSGFSLLIGEAQRRLGRVLSTEELKILLSITNYLGLPTEVVGILITYCIERARARGGARMPSLRTIEKEAYVWADQGVDTLEAAAAYMQSGLERQNRIGSIRHLLQIEGRKLTAGEEKYVRAWLDMGFGEDEIALAYERTCMNTGSLKWPYMNSILTSWYNQGLLTVERINAGDSKPQKKQAPADIGRPGDYEKDAVARRLRGK